MNANMIETLREQFAKVESVDPCGETFKNLLNLLDGLDDLSLTMLVEAGINFVSPLALNRCFRRDIAKSKKPSAGVEWERKAA